MALMTSTPDLCAASEYTLQGQESAVRGFTRVKRHQIWQQQEAMQHTGPNAVGLFGLQSQQPQRPFCHWLGLPGP